jgi:hypothetical protein
VGAGLLRKDGELGLEGGAVGSGAGQLTAQPVDQAVLLQRPLQGGQVDLVTLGPLPEDRVEDRLLLVDVVPDRGLELAEEDLAPLRALAAVELLAPLQQPLELPVVLADQGQCVHAHPSAFGRP